MSLITANEREPIHGHKHQQQQQQNPARVHKSHSKQQMLNVTTNTMQSAVFRELYSTNTTMAQQKQSSVEMCEKFARDLVEIGDACMRGTYGRIRQGTLRQPPLPHADHLDEATKSAAPERSGEELVKVLIKTVNDNATAEQIDLMVRESCAFRGLKHKNLLAVMGLCLEDEMRPMALYAYPEIGNLKSYLVSLKASSAKAKSSEQVDAISTNSASLREQVL